MEMPLEHNCSTQPAKPTSRVRIQRPLRPRNPRLGIPPAFCPSRLAVDAEYSIGQPGDHLQVRIHRRRVVQDRGLPGGLLEGLGQVLYHLPGIFVEQRVVLHDQEAVVVLLQNGHELVDDESPAHIQLRDVAVQPAEDAGVVATDEEDLVALQFRVAVEGAGQQLNRGD